jgi:peptidoglycan/LPS O-acetylase OafA/YrhL
MTARELPRDLPGLTSLRAVAALLVFGYHVGNGVFPGNALGGGYCGVTFFYVLSGFLLTWGTDPTRSRSRFWIRRFARIYPCHAVVWLLVLVLPLVAGPKDPWHATINLLLLHAWSTDLDAVFSMNGVTWSLSCEVFFYAMFPLLFVVTQRLRLRTQWMVAILLFLGATVLVVAGSLAPETDGFALFVGANPLVRIPEFILGVVAARTLQTGRTIPSWSAVVAVAFCAIGLAYFHGSPAGNSWTAPAWLVLIVVVARAAADGRAILAQPWMVYAGKVSFAFYLVHQLTINQTFHLLGAGRWQTALAFVVAGGCAALLHHGVEIPAHLVIVTRFAASKRTTPSDAVAG